MNFAVYKSFLCPSYVNRIHIIAVTNCLIENTNICTSVYQNVRCTLWYTLVHMLVLSIKQFITAMILTQLRMLVPNRKRIYTITDTSRRRLSVRVYILKPVHLLLLSITLLPICHLSVATHKTDVQGMMRHFSWNATRHWLIYSRLHPRQTETSTLSLRKPTISYDDDIALCMLSAIPMRCLKHDMRQRDLISVLLYDAASNSIMYHVIE